MTSVEVDVEAEDDHILVESRPKVRAIARAGITKTTMTTVLRMTTTLRITTGTVVKIRTKATARTIERHTVID